MAGATLALMGAAAVIIGAIVPWVRGGGTPFGSLNAFQVPLAFLFGSSALAGSVNVGIVLALLALLGAGLTFVPGMSFLRRAAGVTAAIAALLFAAQVGRLTDQFGGAASFGDVFGLGPVLTFIGGALMALAKRMR